MEEDDAKSIKGTQSATLEKIFDVKEQRNLNTKNETSTDAIKSDFEYARKARKLPDKKRG